jgi:hypothetical protein
VARRFVHIQETSFASARTEVGLAGRNFDHFFEKVEASLDSNPWFYGTEVPDGDGLLVIPTTDAFPDLPASYIYFRADPDAGEVRYVGISPAWSRNDTPPADFT